jgi:hypothetical protein
MIRKFVAVHWVGFRRAGGALAICGVLIACGKSAGEDAGSSSSTEPRQGESGNSVSASGGGSAQAGAPGSSTGGAVLMGGAPGTGGSGESLTLGKGGKDAFESAGYEVVSDLPPGVELVPGPTPDVTPSPRALDFSGYPEGTSPHHDNGEYASDSCDECTGSEFCMGPPLPGTLAPRACGWFPSGNSLLPLLSCTNRPVRCHGDCPVVCGCDGKLYCNSCIANAWGWHRNPVDDPAHCVAGYEGTP